MNSQGKRRILTALISSVCLSLSVVVPASAQEEQGIPEDQFAAEVTANVDKPIVSVPEEGADRFIVAYKNKTRNDLTRPAAAKLRQSVFSAPALNQGTRAVEDRQMHNGSSVVQLDHVLDQEAAKQFIADVQADENVAYVDVDRVAYPDASLPTDPKYPQQWHDKPVSETNPWAKGIGLYGANVEGAWDLGYTGKGVTVAIVDTGLTDHPDLERNTLPGASYDFISHAERSRDTVGRDNDAHDMGDWYEVGECGARSKGRESTWHGTHVAGIIGATHNNEGVAGTAANVEMYHARALGKCGGLTSDIADAIAWSGGADVPGAPKNEHPADLINMSLGGEGYCSPTYQDGINAANKAGARIIVSAGNENQSTFMKEPASCAGVMVVAATNPEGRKASYSNRGDEVDIAAPGGDQNYIDYSDMKAKHDPNRGIWSTLNDGEKGLGQPNYEPYDGTSMATPLVTGIAALMLEANPSLTLAQIQEAMQTTAVDFSKNEYKMGPGIVNAEAAVRAVMTEEPQPEPTEETPVTETVTNVVTATETATEVKTVEETVTEEVEPSEPIVVTETAIREPATTTVFATETQIEKVPGKKITTTVAPEPVTVVKDPVEETTVVEADDVTETSTVTSTRTTTLPQKTVVETAPAGEDETVTAEPSTVTLAPVTDTEPADEPVVTVTNVITPEPGKATVTSTAKETETTTVTSTRRVSDNGSEVPQTTTTVIVAPDRGSSDLDPEDVANGSSHAKKWSVVMLILGILAVLLPQFAQNNLSSFALPDMSRLRTFIK